MEPTTLGDLEIEILRFVSEHAPISVGEVAIQFGEPRGLARTTILTVMERLRQKDYLHRTKDVSVFRYGPRVAQGDVMKGLVRDFVRKALGGTVTPFVAYLADTDDLSTDEITALRRFVETLPDTPKEEEKQP